MSTQIKETGGKGIKPKLATICIVLGLLAPVIFLVWELWPIKIRLQGRMINNIVGLSRDEAIKPVASQYVKLKTYYICVNSPCSMTLEDGDEVRTVWQGWSNQNGEIIVPRWVKAEWFKNGSGCTDFYCKVGMDSGRLEGGQFKLENHFSYSGISSRSIENGVLVITLTHY